MSVRMNCPSCGTRFSVTTDDRFVSCPACGRSDRVKRS